jgi:hypothetical protein
MRKTIPSGGWIRQDFSASESKDSPAPIQLKSLIHPQGIQNGKRKRSGGIIQIETADASLIPVRAPKPLVGLSVTGMTVFAIANCDEVILINRTQIGEDCGGCTGTWQTAA